MPNVYDVSYDDGDDFIEYLKAKYPKEESKQSEYKVKIIYQLVVINYYSEEVIGYYVNLNLIEEAKSQLAAGLKFRVNKIEVVLGKK